MEMNKELIYIEEVTCNIGCKDYSEINSLIRIEKIDENYNQSFLDFIGDSDESTEIDSIVAYLDQAFSTKNKEEETCEDILNILGRKDGGNIEKENLRQNVNGEIIRELSKSNPQFYSKKLSMKGRVLKSVNNFESNSQCTFASKNSTKHIPERVSNPFSQRNNFNYFDSLDSNYNKAIKNYN
jgi:hypothetical protein